MKSICGMGSNGSFQEGEYSVVSSEPGEVNLLSKCEMMAGQCLVLI